MNRRAFLGASCAYMLSSGSKLMGQCVLVAPGMAGCSVSLSVPSILLAATYQQCPAWCWAASMSAVFKFFGHPVDQKKIVAQTYGQLVCLTVGNSQVASDLSSNWTDDSGQNFSSAITAAYDANAGLLAINNAIVINELANGRPLFYGNSHHAMVVCGINYRQTAQGLAVDRMLVMDPWPPSFGVHALSPMEMIPAHMGGDMHFLAAVSIS